MNIDVFEYFCCCIAIGYGIVGNELVDNQVRNVIGIQDVKSLMTSI